MNVMTAGRRKYAWALSAGLVLFLSSNFVNAGNLLFNLAFSHWMGPELFSDLAFLLTLKLSILSVLGALQFLVTEKTAEASKREQMGNIQAYRKINQTVSVFIFLFLPLLIYLTITFNLSEKLGLHDEYALIVFYFGFPLYLPIALWRGVAQGRMDLWRMVSSANVEMIVRFGGAALFWWIGLGMWAVILAFVLSLFAAWVFAQPAMPRHSVPARDLSHALPWRHALPWAAIQLGVVLMLDGDVFVTKLTLPSTEAGFIAAISLVQRIIFFASFSLATILLPQVIQAVKGGRSGMREAMPIIGLIAISIAPVIIVSLYFPNQMVLILFGDQYLSIAPQLITASMSASLITINYFIVVFLMAHQKRLVGYLFFLLSVLQLIFLRGSYYFHEPSVASLVQFKFYFQSLSVIFVITIAFFALKTQIAKTKGVLNE